MTAVVVVVVMVVEAVVVVVVMVVAVLVVALVVVVPVLVVASDGKVTLYCITHLATLLMMQ